MILKSEFGRGKAFSWILDGKRDQHRLSMPCLLGLALPALPSPIPIADKLNQGKRFFVWFGFLFCCFLLLFYVLGFFLVGFFGLAWFGLIFIIFF